MLGTIVALNHLTGSFILHLGGREYALVAPQGAVELQMNAQITGDVDARAFVTLVDTQTGLQFEAFGVTGRDTFDNCHAILEAASNSAPVSVR